MIDADYADDLALLSNIPAQAEYLLHGLKQAARDTDFYVNINNTEYLCFKQKGAIYTLSGKPLKLMDKCTYLDGNISFTESDVNVAKTQNTIDRQELTSARYRRKMQSRRHDRCDEW